MMAAVSDHSNRNVGSVMGVSEAERIASKLISRLLLVSGPLLLFSVRFW